MSLGFRIERRDGAARLGVLTTPHGEIETPAFMPVGTLGAVKGLGPHELEAAGAQVMLANLYHLTLRPGIEIVEGLGGIHRLTGWRKPILTDSGGYQVFSLAERRELDDDGVTFSSHVDGERIRFTPESVVDAQRRMGVDVAMVLDECPPWPIDRDAAARSLDRTLAWARRARREWERRPGPGGLFGIVQGSVYREQRERSAAALAEIGFDGYAVGGVSVGEPPAERRSAVEWSAAALPEDRPRYLMGIGYPQDIRHAVEAGVDLFDCVLPSRNARHGLLFTRQGELRIKNARFKDDPRPVDEHCDCPACRRVSRAFLHHLVRTKELTGAVLSTLHNVRHYLDFMRELRHSIASGTLRQSGPRPPVGDDLP